MNIELDVLRRLQDWYASQCNGNWEHAYGVSITTLDNPGWSFAVELTGTDLCDQPFDEVSVEGANKGDWYVCRINGRLFEGHCGPKRLNDVIDVFLKWANP